MVPDVNSLVASQRWKLYVAFAFVMTSAFLIWFGRPIESALAFPEHSLSLVGTAGGFVTLIVASLSIRCPNCKLSLVWFAVSRKHSDAWLSWLLDARSCPRCSHPSRSENPKK